MQQRTKKRGDIYDTQINQANITNNREYQNNMVNDMYNFMDIYEDQHKIKRFYNHKHIIVPYND